MFVTKAHHAEVVERYKAELAHTRGELEWYRKTFFSNHGFHYPEAAQSDVSPVPQPIVSEIDERKRFRLNREEWTQSDDGLFREFWVAEYDKTGKPPDEVEYWYKQEYGQAPPSQAWQV